jgi:hypothetical protein
MKEEDRLFITKVKKLIPEDEQRILMLTTLLGMSGVLAEFVMTENKVKDLPIIIQYACANIAGNMVAFISDGQRAQFKNLEDYPYEMGEQTQERIYRKMKWIVESLYESIQEKEKI